MTIQVSFLQTPGFVASKSAPPALPETGGATDELLTFKLAGVDSFPCS